ncbi:hypothetical protein [Phyllobacterium sp. YR531]|uniref:hypothetical protein n=1 Tax=Phyllobacterium sp. YR531 TaxID=1144343 RepID=UPI00026F5B18|nr:hypothetical protein [Phyllobacterium sp. YR531]EJN03831.1 hypothetical protein PMI41_01466 [Phyllobacterium sp. YR531]
MAAGETLYGRGVAMSQVVEKRRPQILRVAHLNIAIPVSDHHPVNMRYTSTTARHAVM